MTLYPSIRSSLPSFPLSLHHLSDQLVNTTVVGLPLFLITLFVFSRARAIIFKQYASLIVIDSRKAASMYVCICEFEAEISNKNCNIPDISEWENKPITCYLFWFDALNEITTPEAEERLHQLPEGFELANIYIKAVFLGMFGPKG
jgi:hypothetical protein